MAQLRLSRERSFTWKELDINLRKYRYKPMGTWWADEGVAAQGKC